MNSTALLKLEKNRKVIKPIIKKQPIAKINNCLEYWMNCIIDSMQQEEVHVLKSRKTGISNKAFHHWKKVRSTAFFDKQESFRKGYVNAANEVSITLAFVPRMDINVGKKLLTHLGHQLNHVIEASTREQSVSPIPESSGYGSDDSDSVWRQW